MSMLSSQADELRGYALSVRNVALRTTSLCHEARRDLLDSAVRMEQAADTIESLRDRLQDIELGRGTCEMHRYKNALGFIDEWQCSECGADVSGIADDTPPNHCPSCGAKVER